MNFVKHFDLFGVEAKQIPCLLGEGAPTTATEGAVGVMYMDTLTADVYLCTAVTDGVYTWGAFKGSGGGDLPTVTEINENSDDNHIPTAKATYTLFNDFCTEINALLESIVNGEETASE